MQVTALTLDALHAHGIIKGDEQKEAVEWVLDREQWTDNGTSSGIVAMAPGMGKTHVMLAVLAANPKRTTLLVAPACVLDQ